MAKTHQSTPPVHEGKHLESFGLCFYSSAALGIKGCNYLACIGRYFYAVLDDFSDLFQYMPEEKRPRALPLQHDGLAADKEQVSTVKYVLESSACTLSMAVSVCCHSWLRCTHLLRDTRLLGENLPFNGTSLFNVEIDSTPLCWTKILRLLGHWELGCKMSFRNNQHFCFAILTSLLFFTYSNIRML